MLALRHFLWRAVRDDSVPADEDPVRMVAEDAAGRPVVVLLSALPLPAAVWDGWTCLPALCAPYALCLLPLTASTLLPALRATPRMPAEASLALPSWHTALLPFAS